MRIIALLCLVISLSACTLFADRSDQQEAVSSSLMQYLYPQTSERRSQHPVTPTIPQPANVGIAFVSSQDHADAISPEQATQLLEQIRHRFAQQPYVGRLELIPSSALNGNPGFDGLRHVARRYDVDLMALIASDQIRQRGENPHAVSYWSIVGLYSFPGNEASVRTFVTTTVIDVASEQLLFHASGLHQIRDSDDTDIDNIPAAGAQIGSAQAADDMLSTLDNELERFSARMGQQRTGQIEPGAGFGSGVLTPIPFAALLLFGFARRRSRR
ncbi:rhombotarget lipoprotein [Ferrimonas pelagia]|uniref:Rhombotarget lipoprotein n=1 Tax=Ferrimonas pelagia TaxID=1177826 RepID=A0ABP9EK85_9GAMM